MVDYYNLETYQFEMKNEETKNRVIEYLQTKEGFDIQIIEDPSEWVLEIICGCGRAYYAGQRMAL
jgi:hypothetical protein